MNDMAGTMIAPPRKREVGRHLLLGDQGIVREGSLTLLFLVRAFVPFSLTAAAAAIATSAYWFDALGASTSATIATLWFVGQSS